MNLFDGVLIETGEDDSRVRLNSGEEIDVAVNTAAGKAGDKVVLGIRPQDVLLMTEGANLISGTVHTLEHLGAETFIYLDHGDIRESLTVRVEDSHRRAEGDSIAMQLPAECCHLFDAEGLSFRRTRAPAFD